MNRTESAAQNKITRRRFNSAVAASATISIVPRHILGKGKKPPSDKLNIACIGASGIGMANVRACGDENIVALCDVDWKEAAGAFKKYPKSAKYKDFRVMLDKQKNIDAVIVATPDHTHAVITMAAMQTGKHVYCQKPLTRTVHEAREITAAARKYKVRTQMGNQGHSFEHIRLLKEWLAAGVLGQVREVHAWSDRPIGKPSYANFAVRELPKGNPQCPDHLDWDLWIGPQKYRPYHPAYHPFKWRGWLDFGTGSLGDMGCHILDPSFWALELGHPKSIRAEVEHVKPELADEVFPISVKLTYEFPARGNMPPVTLKWFDGHFKVPRPKELEEGRKLDSSGAVIYGEKATVKHGSHGARGLRIIPESRMKELRSSLPPKTIPRIKGGHEKDWIRSCKGGREASSNFDYGGPLTEMVLLGVPAMRLPGEKLLWDANKRKFTNNEKANELLHYDYRNGWKL